MSNTTWLGFAAVYFLLIFATPSRLQCRGKILSRWMARLLRIRRHLWVLRLGQLLTLGMLQEFLEAVGYSDRLAETVYWLGGCALWLDDILTGDDKDPRWRRAVGKVKLKMPAPVKLRPIEKAGA